MRVTMLGLAGLLLAAGSLAGCSAHRPPDSAVRLASFDPLRATRLNGEPLSDFMRSRSAILIDGTKVTVERSPRGSNAMTVRFAGSSGYGASMAAAIDPRGYFLTAGRSLRRSPVYLISHDGIGFRVFEARVVWRGIYEEGQPDLALLHVDRPLLFTFEWDDRWEAGEPVGSLGMEFSAETGYSLTSLGGEIQRVTEHPDNVPHRTSFFHSAPVQGGDSGGPVVGADGRLLAINVGIIRSFELRALGYETSARAHRPDTAWLRALINEDFARVNPAAAGAF